MTLIEHLQQLPDFRKARGQRHPQWLLLLLLLGAMSGYRGWRPLAEFTQRYGSAIYAELNWPAQTRLPSYSTFRRLMQGLDYPLLATLFTDWASTSRAFAKKTGWRAMVPRGNPHPSQGCRAKLCQLSLGLWASHQQSEGGDADGKQARK